MISMAKLGGAILIGLEILCCISCSKSFPAAVGHQRSYGWDKFGLPELRFTNATVSEIVAVVNKAVRLASGGTVTQAIILNETPVPIVAVTSDPEIRTAMDRLIVDYREDEMRLAKRGAEGFETCRHTGTFLANHSLGCSLSEVASEAGLNYEERRDAIHLGRMPAQLECMAYKVSAGLKLLGEDLVRRNQHRVGAETVVSAFIEVADVHLWSVMLPNKGPGSFVGESRFDKVFKYLPDKSTLLVIETPENQEKATKALKARGLWEAL